MMRECTVQLRVYFLDEMSYDREQTEFRHEFSMNKKDQVTTRRWIVRCPACGKEAAYDGNPYRPFCSRGCKGIDLINWATESYRIEGKPEEDRADDESD